MTCYYILYRCTRRKNKTKTSSAIPKISAKQKRNELLNVPPKAQWIASSGLSVNPLQAMLRPGLAFIEMSQCETVLK